jgi:hypothetical protein
MQARVIGFVGVCLTCLAAAGGYAWWVAATRMGSVGTMGTGPATRVEQALSTLPAAPYTLMRQASLGSTHGRLALETPANSEAGLRQVSPLSCDRVHVARAGSGRGICLEARRGALTTYHAQLFDRSFDVQASFPLAGEPSRTRMSADGTLAAATVFVSGHSYSSPGFSTRTSIFDVAGARMLVADLEAFTVFKDGQVFKQTDFNFWGVSFTPDAKGFYATLQSGSKLWLVKGDIALKNMTVVAPDVECPSLSPDGTRIAFKRRTTILPEGRLVWQIVVRELASGSEKLLSAETRSVDDQVEWIDDREIAYALPASKPGATDIWALNTEAQGAPRLWMPMASSPAVVR